MEKSRVVWPDCKVNERQKLQRLEKRVGTATWRS